MVSAFPQPHAAARSSESVHLPPYTSKYCKRFASVAYYDMWGPLFIEDSYKCNFTAGSASASAESEEPVLESRQFIKSNRYGDGRNDAGVAKLVVEEGENTLSNLPQHQHQIISFGCIPLPDAQPIDYTKDSTLLTVIPEVTNQSCLPPDHLREFREYPRSWTAHWAFTNINRGSEVICDWYQELNKVAKALNFYCENSLERQRDEDSLREVLAYGRDKERDPAGGQLWCLRYSDRGWGFSGFDEKCLGVHAGGGSTEEGQQEEDRVQQFGEGEL